MKLRNSEKCAILITLLFLALVLGFHLGTRRSEASFNVIEDFTAASPAPAAKPDSDAAEEYTGEKININTANAIELQKLEGIGPVLAQRIIDYREANGGFDTIEDITSVSGISVKTYEANRDRITVE